jgi:hypothetical protein
MTAAPAELKDNSWGDWFAEQNRALLDDLGVAPVEKSIDELLAISDRLLKDGWEDVPRDDKGQWTGDGSAKPKSSDAAHRAHITMLQRKLEGANPADRARIQAKIDEHQRAIGQSSAKPAEAPKPAAAKPAPAAPEKPADYRSMNPRQFRETLNGELKTAGLNVQMVGDLHPDFRDEFAKELKTLATQYPLDQRTVVTIDKPLGGTARTLGQAYQTLATKDKPASGIICMSSHFFGTNADPRGTRDTIAYAGGDTRFHDGMTEPMSILAHEYGHHVDFALYRMQGGLPLTNKFGLSTNPGWSEHGGKDMNPMATTAANPRTPVTVYGLTNNKEYFAETFAASVRGYGDAKAAAADHVHAITDFVERTFKERRHT